MKIPMIFHKTSRFHIPKLGMGTWQLLGYECTEIVATGLSAGYRLIDTAQAYDNEEYVGAGIEESGVPRREIFLVSKVERDNLSREKVVDSTRRSLEKLKTDYVDLMLIHWPNEEFSLDETLAGMEELLHEGLAKNFGVSNFPIEWLEEAQALAPEFVCNQVEYHPFISQAPVLEWLKERDKFLMAYSPLARGEIFENEVIKNIAHKHASGPAQVTLAWLIRQEGVIALPKTSTIQHLHANLESLVLQLDSEDLQNLNNLRVLNKRVVDPDFAPRWDLPYRRRAPSSTLRT